MKSLLSVVLIVGLAAGVFWFATAAEDVQAGAGHVQAPADVPDPVRLGEETPAGFRQLLPRDAILPIYNPTFVDAGSASWEEKALVIGVELAGEAKAYPVSFLNRREMVIDWIGGTPILVSW